MKLVLGTTDVSLKSMLLKSGSNDPGENPQGLQRGRSRSGTESSRRFAAKNSTEQPGLMHRLSYQKPVVSTCSEVADLYRMYRKSACHCKIGSGACSLHQAGDFSLVY